MTEPVLDLSEIVGLYKEDARRSIELMRAAAHSWDDVRQGGAARIQLRKLAHQLRGSGRTYGFRSVTRIGKALEHMMIKLQAKRVQPDERVQKCVTRLIERLAITFR